MIYVFGGNSSVLADFVRKNDCYLITRSPETDRNIFWDLSRPVVPDRLIDLFSGDNSIVIIYAAAFKEDGLFINCKNDEICESVNVNFLSYCEVVKAVIPHMVKSEFGKLIYIGSSYAEVDRTGSLIYAATKAASIDLTLGIAQEYARFNISSNVLMLGFHESPLWNKINVLKRNKMLERAPTKKIGDINDVNLIIEFIINSSSYFSGSKLYLNGAMTK